jgi:hypothetical protein
VSTAALVAAGLVAGVLMGAVLRRTDLCFHAMFRSAWQRDADLLATWTLGVGVGAVGLAVLFETSVGNDLNRGLPFDPVRNVTGGLLVGAGMAVARSCTSGLFYKLGAGMLGALGGLAGWAAGELAVRDIDPPGGAILDGGDTATVAGVLDVPRLVVALGLFVGSAWWALRRHRSSTARWSPAPAGVALGLALVAAWALAGWSGASFGPGTVGAASGVADWITDGSAPPRWLLGFLAGIVAGSFALSLARRSVRVRGETRVRYGQLIAGGFLLGAGGRIGGGCNLGHGLSGTAQLGVSSWVSVASMAVGVLVVGRVIAALGSSTQPWRAESLAEA